MPTPLVRFDCGSMSTRSTRCPARASEAPRLMAVVVFATPPFWLAMAMILVLLVINQNDWVFAVVLSELWTSSAAESIGCRTRPRIVPRGTAKDGWNAFLTTAWSHLDGGRSQNRPQMKLMRHMSTWRQR